MAGRVDVDRMLSEVPAHTIQEWKEYERINGRLDKSWDREAQVITDLHIQQLIQITLAANSEKGKTKFKPDPIMLPWETEESRAAQKKARAPVRSGPKHEEDKRKFYEQLAARNKKRGITPKTLAEKKAKAESKAARLEKLGIDPAKKRAGERWR